MRWYLKTICQPESKKQEPVFLYCCFAEIQLLNVVKQLLGYLKWLLGRGYKVVMSLLMDCLIGRVKRAHSQVSMSFWSKDMMSDNFSNVKSMGYFHKIFSPVVRTSYARSLIKVIAHLSSISRTIWHLIHGSPTNGAGGVARQKFFRANSNSDALPSASTTN